MFEAMVPDDSADVEAEEPAPLSWRDDKEASLSDWTLVIAQQNAGATQTYYVHRATLATGPRGLEYFKTIFHGCELTEHGDSTSRIELRPSAAAAVPALLDFAYGAKLAATTESATVRRPASFAAASARR